MSNLAQLYPRGELASPGAETGSLPLLPTLLLGGAPVSSEGSARKACGECGARLESTGCGSGGGLPLACSLHASAWLWGAGGRGQARRWVVPGVPGRTGEEEEKSSPLTSRPCTAGTGREVDMQRPDTGRQKSPPPAAAPTPPRARRAASGGHACPLECGEKPSLGSRGPGQRHSLWEALSFLGEWGAQGPGLPESSGAPSQYQVGLTGPDSSPLHCSET